MSSGGCRPASAPAADGASRAEESQGATAPGVPTRPPQPGAADARPLVIGIDLGGTKCHGMLAQQDGSGVIQDVRRTDPEDAYGTVLACATSLQDRASATGRSVAAIGVGVPAVIEPQSG
ncbi:MAG TPA: ROK family protein, partial [Euzebya sp.]|nr:ROK family protein [Euzebya sp.]